jgi:ubiquinol-cytochrome c reductase cytochrome b subunit
VWIRVSYANHKPLEIEPEFNERGVRRKGYKMDRRRQRLSEFFFEDRVEPVTPAELAEAKHAHH